MDLGEYSLKTKRCRRRYSRPDRRELKSDGLASISHLYRILTAAIVDQRGRSYIDIVERNVPRGSDEILYYKFKYVRVAACVRRDTYERHVFVSAARTCLREISTIDQTTNPNI